MITCPICSQNLKKSQEDLDRLFCYNDRFVTNYSLDFYKITLFANNTTYRIESFIKENKSTLFIVNDKFTKMDLNFYIPIPKNKEDIENIIKRILNLKAFL